MEKDNSNVIDFGAIEEEVSENLAKESETDKDEGVVSKEDLFNDLLSEIDEKEAEDLNINEVHDRGIVSSFQAEYFIRRYKELNQKVEDVTSVANKAEKDYIDKVETWKNKQLEETQNQMNYISSVLEEYCREELSGKKKRSLKMIEGTISFKKQQPKYDVDKDKLRDYLVEHSDNCRQYLENLPPKVKWDEFKKAGKLDEDGIFRYGKDAVPGVVVTQRPDKFSIR